MQQPARAIERTTWHGAPKATEALPRRDDELEVILHLRSTAELQRAATAELTKMGPG